MFKGLPIFKRFITKFLLKAHTVFILFLMPNIYTFRIMHWALSAGPYFADSIHYVALFSDEYATSLFGENPAPMEDQYFVQDILKHCGIVRPEDILVKIMNEKPQQYIISAVVCTQTSIFLNTSIYYYLPKREKRALIAEAAVMMQQKHLVKNAFFLTLVPFISYALIEFGKYCAHSIIDNFYNKKSPTKKRLKRGVTFICQFWGTKLILSSALANLYFKWQAKQNDIIVSKKYGIAGDLLRYYFKVAKYHKSNFADTLSPCSPGLRDSVHYLLPLTKNK